MSQLQGAMETLFSSSGCSLQRCSDVCMNMDHEASTSRSYVVCKHGDCLNVLGVDKCTFNVVKDTDKPMR